MRQRESKELEALAEALARKVRRDKRDKPKLTIVQVAPEARPKYYDAITRQSIITRVRYLCRAYHLKWLLDQETFNIACIECLDDGELRALLTDLERARECIAEGVPFEDAGLVRNTSEMLQTY